MLKLKLNFPFILMWLEENVKVHVWLALDFFCCCLLFSFFVVLVIKLRTIRMPSTHPATKPSHYISIVLL
jgi:hypothetical protein